MAQVILISIHAPTRGATIKRRFKTIRLSFQSTLPQGERPSREASRYTADRFQSTLPQGERPPVGSGASATGQFQSTLPQGERRFCFHVFCCKINKFQSTLPQGERRISGYLTELCKGDFNPRSHKGSDCNLHKTTYGLSPISIHAPTRGATCRNLSSLNLRQFQSTLPQGERPW